MIGRDVPFTGDDEIGRWLSVIEACNAVIADIAAVPISTREGIGYRDGMVKMAAVLKSRAMATLDVLDKDWRRVEAVLDEMLAGK